MQEVLSEAACRAAGAYFTQKRRAGRRALLLAAGCFAAGAGLTALLWPRLGAGAAAFCGVLLCFFLLMAIIQLKKRYRKTGEGYLDTVRPVLARELYPDCTFALLGTRQDMQKRLQAAAVWVIGGELAEYGGSICLSTPVGTVYAHDFTEDCRPGDSDSHALQDWVVYELALPEGSPWRSNGMAQIRRGRTGDRHFAAVLQRALHQLPRMVDRGLPENRIEGTPLVLSTTDTAYFQTVLAQVGTQALEDFFRLCGSCNTVCYCGSTLYVFARGQRLDQRWSDSRRLEPEAVSRNAAAVERTIHALEALV